MDSVSKAVRSHIMSSIHGRDTKPEVALRKELFRKGYRYSLRYRFKEGNFRPDIVMVSRRVCIFVDGCFWHKCPICYRPPKSNKMYWLAKLERNRQRDRQQDVYLRKHGWKVVRVWEHELDVIKSVVEEVELRIKNAESSQVISSVYTSRDSHLDFRGERI